MPRDNIVVAGAGIIGASIAYHLAKRGARVTILDAVQPGAGASGRSLGWLNATFSKRPRGYFDLNFAALAAWRDLDRELAGELKIQWGGSVAWCPPGSDAAELQENVRHHQAWGYAVRLVEPDEFPRLLPEVVPGEIGAACHAEPEGAVDPLEALQILLKKARELGAELRYPCGVTALTHASNGTLSVRTSEGTLEADTLVLAAGIGAPGLAQMADVRIPLKESPGILIHTAPARRLIDRVALAPGTHFKQGFDGRVIAGGQIVAGVGTAITHADVSQAEGVRSHLEKYLPQLNGISLEGITVGHRVMAIDEYPIVGFANAARNLYVAAMHSGVTLAPLIGKLAATEILDGVQAKTLEPYRPSRFE